jgi:16S rRNA (uracil1498-N3)-methyltransferase
MREPRVFVDQPLQPGQVIALGPAASRHLLTVLRLNEDARLRLFNGDGRELLGRLVVAGRATARVRLVEVARREPDARLQLNLLLGVSRGERMEFALQKSVELGATGITAVLAERTVSRLRGPRRERRRKHWWSVIVAACEQSGRCRLPRFQIAEGLDAGLGSAGADRRLLLHPTGALGLGSVAAPERGFDILVGPEGGLSDAETRSALAEGFVPVRLGPRVLRSETAPLAALAAIQALWGDFRQA